MIEGCRVGMKRLSFLKLIFNTFCLKRRPRKQKEADGETKRSERRRHDHSRRIRFCHLVLTGAERSYQQFRVIELSRIKNRNCYWKKKLNGRTISICIYIHIWVRFPRTGKMVKMWHF